MCRKGKILLPPLTTHMESVNYAALCIKSMLDDGEKSIILFFVVSENCIGN